MPPCAGCGHHVSMHRYVIDDTKKGNPPRHCDAPGCTCKQYHNRTNCTLEQVQEHDKGDRT